ncbi:hypothetical protein [Klebsiella huaxiensis]|nr:hypothetical protein [Klebsiella huaxiensis]
MSRKKKNPGKSRMRRLANNPPQQQHPAIRFINSTDFIGKLATGIILFGITIYNFNEIIQHWWINALLWLSMFLWPFAKRMADDLLLSIVSERVFEVINGGGIGRFGALYWFVLAPLTLPLAIGYFCYHSCKWKKAQANERAGSALK